MLNMHKRLLVVSNRLPIEIVKEEVGWSVKPSPGGLVTALSPLMRRSHGTWIGWPGCAENVPARKLIEAAPDKEFNLTPVILTADQVEKYYRGFANKSIWPLFHDLLGNFSYSAENWASYKEVNRHFAEITKKVMHKDNFVWIHDFQLMLVGNFLRLLGVKGQLSYFLHIPFPSPDVIRRLPHHLEIIKALLAYDKFGFQTAQDKANFLQCLKEYIPGITRESAGKMSILHYEQREIYLVSFPISIDFDEFDRGARTPEVERAAAVLRQNMKAEKIVLGLDRLDYTKGIPERFLAFEKLLEKYPEVRGKISLLQVVIPSRLNVPDYQKLKSDLDSIAGRINGAYTEKGWIPIHYVFRSLDRTNLLAHYRASGIALITPLRDGMNLVSKEYCASNINNEGVLILSEFAGSANQLGKAAILVNPYDSESTADALYLAFKMPAGERQKRMEILRAEIKRNNVLRWIKWFIAEVELEEVTEEVTA